jgi:hypothetical protein
MLLPPLGDSGLTGQQDAKILERDPLGEQCQHRRSNGYRYGPTPPSTPKRHCSLSTQRHTATSCHRRAAGRRQCDVFFMV